MRSRPAARAAQDGGKTHVDLRPSEQQGNGANMMVQVGGDGFNGPSRFTFLFGVRQRSKLGP